jgi:hypothetical protein
MCAFLHNSSVDPKPQNPFCNYIRFFWFLSVNFNIFMMKEETIAEWATDSPVTKVRTEENKDNV